MDNIKTWIGLSVEESARMTEDREKCRNYIHPILGSRTAKEQNRTVVVKVDANSKRFIHLAAMWLETTHTHTTV